VCWQRASATTSASPRSTFATATASTPIGWDELTPKLDVRAFTLRSLQARLDKRGDLAAPLLGPGVKLEAALAQLRRQ